MPRDTDLFQFKKQTVSPQDIQDHFSRCDPVFVQTLTARVDLNAYSDKIATKAVTYEAWDNGHLIGLAAVYFNYPDRVVYITNISVVADRTGRGVASQLLAMCHRDAATALFSKLKLEVRRDNMAAARFYEQAGFQVTAQNADTCYMEKAISSPYAIKPKVSVLIVAYNHATTIAKALDSILEQEVDFPIEIIITDDASADDTPAILRDYQSRYPLIVKPILGQENIGPGPNFTRALNEIKGEYQAYCDGDDYWCHPRKLRIAVDTLDRNRDCTIFVHDTEIHDIRNHTVRRMTKTWWKKTLFRHRFSLPRNQYTHISARVFRHMDFPYNGDTFMYHYLLSKGKGYYHDEVMSVYNYNGQGAWSRLTPQQQKLGNYKTIHSLNVALEFKYDLYYTLLMPKKLIWYKIRNGTEKGWDKFMATLASA